MYSCVHLGQDYLMHTNCISKIKYNQASCDNTRQFQYGITAPSFKAKLPKNAEKQISDETLKIVSTAIAASGIVYIGENGHGSKLSKKQQEEIIEKYMQGESSEKLAIDYNCSRSLMN